MATRRSKKADKPLLWNPNRTTPYITATGIAIGSLYQPPARSDITPEELWIQKLLLPSGPTIRQYNLADRITMAASVVTILAVLYLVLRR
jgi:hypothetical protein